MSNPLDGYPVTQDWEQHLRNAGPTLGGVDYDMPIGTPLPVLAGVLEWVTPLWPLIKPRWYNRGLGNAAAYRRPDGSRTVYGHCSRVVDGVVLSGNTDKSSGPHVHAHDVLPDGVTRARPFSTIAGGGAGGFTPSPDLNEQGEEDVDTFLAEITDGAGRYGGGKGTKYYSLVTPSTGRVVKINDPALADQLTDRFGRRAADGTPLGAGYNCAYSDWVQLHGGSYDPRTP